MRARLFFIFFLFLFGCNDPWTMEDSWDDWRSRQLFPEVEPDLSLTDQEIDQLAYEAFLFVHYNIQSIPEPEGEDYWQTSEETLSIMGGDCEDIAILMYIMLIEQGVDPQLMEMAVQQSNATGELHLFIFVRGKTYMRIVGRNYDDRTLFRFTKDYFRIG